MIAENPHVDKRPVQLERLEDDRLWRVLLATPKSNIIDQEKTEILTDTFERAREERALRAIIIEGVGPNFSFGASVEEHLPDKIAAMLESFHRLFYTMLDSAVPTLAAVRGQCLGGGLELAAFCNRVFVAPDARLGQPEIVLGVFPPVASVILARRIGQSRAEHLCLSGHSLSAEEALSIGLADEIADDPGEGALAYARRHLLPRSASSLRLAVRAVRQDFAERLRQQLPRVEKLYLDDLMATEDAVEGLRAFLEKREPRWTNR